MALISCYDDAHGDTIWVVERSNGSSDDRKRFYTYEEAELYMNYLKSVEDREQGLVQQQQIIDNQQKLIELQKEQQRRPQVSRQVLDPQYEEWLRFKKETDPAYRKWKEERDAKNARENAEKNRIAEERRKQQREMFWKSEVGVYRAKFPRYNSVIRTYEKWLPIVKKLSFYGSSPLCDIITKYPNSSSYDYGVKEFIRYGEYSMKCFKKVYLEMQNEYRQRSLVSVELEYSFWENHYRDLVRWHKDLQKSIGDVDSKIGFRYYLKFLIGNLCDARDYRRWGFFGRDGSIRRKFKDYWEEFQCIYPIIEPHINSWANDIQSMYIVNYEDEENDD